MQKIFNLLLPQPLNRQAQALLGLMGVMGLLVCSFLGGCAGVSDASGAANIPNPGTASLYKCNNAITFSARFVDDTAVLDGTRGHELLYRDAGGQGELQSVYSNPQLRAEFGLGASGKEVIFHDLVQPVVLHCLLQ